MTDGLLETGTDSLAWQETECQTNVFQSSAVVHSLQAGSKEDIPVCMLAWFRGWCASAGVVTAALGAQESRFGTAETFTSISYRMLQCASYVTAELGIVKVRFDLELLPETARVKRGDSHNVM